MISAEIPAALRARSRHPPPEAATGLIIAQASWLGRYDLVRFVCHGDLGTAIGREAAITALDAGELLGSGRTKRIWLLALVVLALAVDCWTMHEHRRKAVIEHFDSLCLRMIVFDGFGDRIGLFGQAQR